MPNVHMQEAARNIRRAVSDINLKIQQLKAETDQRVRDIEKRLDEIKAEEAATVAYMTQEDNAVDKTRQQNRIRDLEKEASDLKKEIFDANDNFRKQQSSLGSQATEFESLASRLDTTA